MSALRLDGVVHGLDGAVAGTLADPAVAADEVLGSQEASIHSDAVRKLRIWSRSRLHLGKAQILMLGRCPPISCDETRLEVRCGNRRGNQALLRTGLKLPLGVVSGRFTSRTTSIHLGRRVDDGGHTLMVFDHDGAIGGSMAPSWSNTIRV